MVHPTSKAFDALTRSRLDKDLQELQHMIAQHFEQRKKDDVELDSLVSRIERRKTERGQQMKMRKERDREIQERNAKEKVEREAERKRKADEAEEKKRIQMESVKNYTGYLGQKRNKGNKRITEREKKRKVLIERREPLNIDHLTREKLVAKVGALQTQVVSYEQERFDFEMVAVSQKYQINQQRVRISMLQAKSGMGKSSTSRPKIVSMTNNKAKTVFK